MTTSDAANEKALNHKNSDIPDFVPSWTIQEVASYLRLRPETVRAMARKGDLPAVKVGRVWRFDSEKVKNLLASNT